jgi:hypothetical protein
MKRHIHSRNCVNVDLRRGSPAFKVPGLKIKEVTRYAHRGTSMDFLTSSLLPHQQRPQLSRMPNSWKSPLTLLTAHLPSLPLSRTLYEVSEPRINLQYDTMFFTRAAV